ncbi:MAG TPA: metallophosphoesterase family protein [Spirochaetota bacterium]|nr:metallophosphoesterase family protein [Spirochaetota bacterium]
MGKKLTFLAAADLHGNRQAYKGLAYHARGRDVDLVILAGDLTRYRDDALEEEILNILITIRKPVLFVMGNDDACEWRNEHNLVNLNMIRYVYNDIPFAGYQYSNPFAGGDFEKTEAEQAEDFKTLNDIVDCKTVLVTHNACYGILDEPDAGRHEGGRGLHDLCVNAEPKFHICGHIHESAGVRDNHFNVSWPKRKEIVKIEYYSGMYEFIRNK